MTAKEGESSEDGESGEQAGDIQLMAELFRTVSDPICLILLEFISAAESRTLHECSAHLGMPSCGVRTKLAGLADLGWTNEPAPGRYGLADRRVTELIVLAKGLAAGNARALVYCRHLGQAAPPSLHSL